jgi:RES domain-containing protein
VIVYRLAGQRYAADLSGAGALKTGGRCNRPGVAAVYTSENISLPVLEILVHLDKRDIPEDYALMAIELSSEVPIWYADVSTAYHEADRRFHPVIAVPSVIVPHERNYVLYSEARGLKASIAWTQSFRFDARLFPAWMQ